MKSRTVYHHIDLNTERIEDYRSGGYHPIHIGDRLGPNNRYIIHRNLGWGSEGTVWLAHEPLSVKHWRRVHTELKSDR
jgi:hypothetical protein